MVLSSWLNALRPASAQARRHRRRPAPRLHVEPLEDRLTPSGSHLLVSDWDIGSVLRYDGATGAFVDAFVPKHSGELNHAYGVLFGPYDHDLYVVSGQFGGPGQLKGVLRYDGATGAFREEFTKGGDLDSPRGIIFGPDGNLYVCEGRDTGLGRVARFDGRTGAYLGDFVPTGSGGLSFPQGLVFGPSGRGAAQFDLYVASAQTNRILRYDGGTGAFLGVFAGDDPSTPADEGGGLERPLGLTFGPDGNLYVANASYLTDKNPAVLCFQGPSGPAPGAFLGNFVPPGRGGMLNPDGLIFGPDGNGDRRQDLYVTSVDYTGLKGKLGTVKRYDGITGAFIDTFVSANSGGGMNDPLFMTFTETDPVTLAYTGSGAAAVAASPSASSTAATAGSTQVHGGGGALLTDPSGASFPFTFTLEAMLRSDGPAFGQPWGAVPGVNGIHLTGLVSSVAVAGDGTITLEGHLTEKDYARGGGVPFTEGDAPFAIALRPGAPQFTVQWCELPTFDLEQTDGNPAIH
jgi:hypothetical protein